MDRKTTVVAENVGISARAVLAVDHDVRLDIVALSSVYTREARWLGMPSDISGAWVHLMGRRVRDREAAIVVGDVLVSIVAALAEAFFEAIALVYEDGFVVAGAVHFYICQVSYFLLG